MIWRQKASVKSLWLLRLCGGNCWHFFILILQNNVVIFGGSVQQQKTLIYFCFVHICFRCDRGEWPHFRIYCQRRLPEQLYQSVCQICSLLLVMSVVISCFKAWLTSCHPQTSSVYQQKSLFSYVRRVHLYPACRFLPSFRLNYTPAVTSSVRLNTILGAASHNYSPSRSISYFLVSTLC